MGNGLKDLIKKEDYWAIWLGLLIIAIALVAFLSGGSIKSWAVAPGGWSDVGDLGADMAKHWTGYLIVFLLFGVFFSISIAIMGRKLGEFIPGFIVLFLGSLLMFYLAGSEPMEKADIGAPLLALIIGLVIGNIIKLPAWMETSLRTEYYIKTGIVLLGATLPLTLIFKAGPIAFLQATIVSVGTWLTIYLAATKIFKLEPQFGAVLGAGGAVCGVSASIAIGGAVKAHKDHIAIGIAVVSLWAIVMILALSVALKFMVPDIISPGEAGAWVGTSEFADAAGFAVVAELQAVLEKQGYSNPDAPIQSFTLMKVIGRDIWIGIWCLVLSIVSVVFWEKTLRLGEQTERRGDLGAVPEVRARVLRRVDRDDLRDGVPRSGRGSRRQGPCQGYLQGQDRDHQVRRGLFELRPTGGRGGQVRVRCREGRNHLQRQDEQRGLRRSDRRGARRRELRRRVQTTPRHERLVRQPIQLEDHRPDQEAP
ncbi:MAG: putative sulfate exporter family transporter [Acidobacteria bacterium]|nr:putative sulfate exporter family transporter [Acidobacteriota bacterium]